MSDEDAIVRAAISGYPADQARPLFVDRHDDHAAVLLETGPPGHSYPYFVLLRLEHGDWHEAGSGNMTGWYQTEDDAGAVAFWDDAPDQSDPAEVTYQGERWPAKVKDGVLFAIWWDQLDPSNHIESAWPELGR